METIQEQLARSFKKNNQQMISKRHPVKGEYEIKCVYCLKKFDHMIMRKPPWLSIGKACPNCFEDMQYRRENDLLWNKNGKKKKGEECL